MFNVGGGEMLAVLLLALLVLGPERLPKAMGEVGKWVSQLRRLSSGFQDELKKAMDTPPDGDTPFAPGEESLPALAPGVEEEVRVVHGPGDEVEQVPSETVEAAAVDPVDPVGDEEGAPSETDASVTPLHPRRDDETRATG